MRRYHSRMPVLPEVAAEAEAIAAALHAHGACRIAALPDAALATDLRADLLRLREAGALRAAAVGRGGQRAVHDDVRGDATLWLDDPRCGAAARACLDRLDAVRAELNRCLFLGLADVEAHYAAYPPGTGYARHRDRFRDDDARVLSLVTYLNPDWTEADGGALRLHLATGEAVDVVPRSGSVLFLSELEHEVLPARRERLSIAAWLRRRTLR